MKRIQLFLVNAMIMTATSLLMSGAGVWLNLFVSEQLGPQGMGLYQLILSVYSFAVTLASAGIHLAATRLVAEETADKDSGGVPSAMRLCLLYSACFGLGAGVLLYTCAPMIGASWLCNVQTIRPMRIMALSMPLLSMSCTLGGYFTAVRRVAKSSASQITEQVLRILLVTAGLTFFMRPGNLESACIIIAASGVIAECISFLVELTLFLYDKRRYRDAPTKNQHFVRRLFRIALPVAGSSYIRSGLTTTKNLLVPIRLQTGGLGAGAAVAMFGAVHGVALPVILFPAAFLNSFSGLIIPEMAQNNSRHQNVGGMVHKMFLLNLTVSLGVCGVLFCFSTEIAHAISHNPDIEIYIRLLAPVVPIMYLDTAVDCMLKGLDEQLAVVRYNIYDAAISLLVVWTLLPYLGIKGYIMLICFSELFNFSLSFHRLAVVTGFQPDWIELVVKPLLCAAIAAISVHTTYMAGILPHFGAIGNAIVTCGCTTVVYLGLLWISGCLRISRLRG